METEIVPPAALVKAPFTIIIQPSGMPICPALVSVPPAGVNVCVPFRLRFAADPSEEMVINAGNEAPSERLTQPLSALICTPPGSRSVPPMNHQPPCSVPPTRLAGAAPSVSVTPGSMCTLASGLVEVSRNSGREIVIDSVMYRSPSISRRPEPLSIMLSKRKTAPTRRRSPAPVMLPPSSK